MHLKKNLVSLQQWEVNRFPVRLIFWMSLFLFHSFLLAYLSVIFSHQQRNHVSLPFNLLTVKPWQYPGISYSFFCCFVLLPVIVVYSHRGLFQTWRLNPTINPVQSCSSLNHVPKYDIHKIFRHLRDGDSTISLGSLFWCLTTILVKNFLLIANLLLLCSWILALLATKLIKSMMTKWTRNKSGDFEVCVSWF